MSNNASTNGTEQTVFFRARLAYFNPETYQHRIEEKEFRGIGALEAMLKHYRTERRRRRVADRALSGVYTVELTDHGRDEWKADPERMKISHGPMIGKDFKI